MSRTPPRADTARPALTGTALRAYPADVRFLLALPVVAFVVVLVVGAVRGRVQMRSCCSLPADQDRRLQTEPAGTETSRPVDAPA